MVSVCVCVFFFFFGGGVRVWDVPVGKRKYNITSCFKLKP